MTRTLSKKALMVERILKMILSGNPGPRRDMVLFNAGAAIHLAEKAESLQKGVEKAAESIDSGAAMGRLEALVNFGH